MSERKHADLWRELGAEVGERDIDRAASLSVEQAEAELKAAGFDVAAERANANAFLDALESGVARSAPRLVPQVATPAAHASDEKRRPPRRPAVAWLAAAAAFGGVVGGSLVAVFEQPLMVASPAPAPTASVPAMPDRAAAALLRRQATAACEAKKWSLCLADLDKARAADPGGDEVPAVKGLREEAIAGILQNEEAAPR